MWCCAARSWRKPGSWTRPRLQKAAGSWGEARWQRPLNTQKKAHFKIRPAVSHVVFVLFFSYRKNWSPSWVVLVGNSLVFFKDPKSQTPSSWVSVRLSKAKLSFLPLRKKINKSEILTQGKFMLLQHAGLVSHFKAHRPIFLQYGFFFSFRSIYSVAQKFTTRCSSLSEGWGVTPSCAGNDESLCRTYAEKEVFFNYFFLSLNRNQETVALRAVWI